MSDKLCTKCGKLRDTKHSICKQCRKVAQIRRRQSYKELGLHHCGRKLTDGICIGCKENKHQRKLNNKCGNCNAPTTDGKSNCDKCSQRASTATMQRYHNLKQSKCCVSCHCLLQGNEKFRCKSCNMAHSVLTNGQWHSIRLTVLNHYGDKCACCGVIGDKFLEIDHINNNGASHRRSVGRHIYRWIINNNYPSDLQILCANCNRCKGKFGICCHVDTNIILKRRRLSALKHYGNKCVCCDETNLPFLEFDHIHNDGGKKRKVNREALRILRDLPDDIQLLCSNCNKAKGLYGQCQHNLMISKIV